MPENRRRVGYWRDSDDGAAGTEAGAANDAMDGATDGADVDGAANVPATIAAPMTTQKMITGTHSGIFIPATVRAAVCPAGPA